jgi:hypothetical protein
LIFSSSPWTNSPHHPSFLLPQPRTSPSCPILCPPIPVTIGAHIIHFIHSISIYYQAPTMCQTLFWMLEIWHWEQIEIPHGEEANHK